LDWTTLFVAFLGSSLLTAVVGAVSARLRFSRRADVLSSWKHESELADLLENESGIEDSQRRSRGKAAFAFAARAELNRKLANEMVPPDIFILLLKTVLVVILWAIGLGFIGLGWSGSFGAEFLDWIFVAVGAAVILLFTVFLFASLEANTVRDTLRSVVIRVLNATPPYRSKYVEAVMKGGEVEFKICAKNWRQRFVRNIMGRDVATNCEVFLGKIVNDLDVDSSDFRASSN
jgi:hypothetical protein